MGMEIIQVFLVDLGPIKGMTIKNNDDSYTILINARLSAEMQMETYDHEIEHINNGDYDQIYDVNTLEAVRHSA